MKRFVHTITLAALLAVPLTPPALASPHAMRGAGRGLLRCMKGLDLTADQKAGIKAALEAEKPALQADRGAVRADRQKLRADTEAGADRSVLGSDYLSLRASAKKMRGDMQAARDQVLSKLTADQKAKFQDCRSASGARAGVRRRESSE